MDLKKKSSVRINPPVGNHAARLLKAIDMGTQYSEKYETSSRKIDLTWELVDEKHVFDEEKGEQPFLVSRRYNQNIGPKANLGKVIKGWTGKEPDNNFDINDLFGTPCMVSVVHTEVDKEGEKVTYANVDAITQVPKGLKVAKLSNDIALFDLDDFDQDVFNDLPEFMRDIISESDEYKDAKSSKKPGKTVDFLED